MTDSSSIGQFLVGFTIVVIGYLINSSLLQAYFYGYLFSEVKTWKTQPKFRAANSEPKFFGPPLLTNKPNQAPYHSVFATINLVMAGCFAGYLSYLSYSQERPFSFAPVVQYGIHHVLIELLLAVLWQCVAEYYWHRTMHLKWFYARFHKIHHAYKAPEVWDDMYIHPLEAFGYYCILYAPPFLLKQLSPHMHILSFVLYMIIMGVCGVLDHCGASIALHFPLPFSWSRGSSKRPVLTIYDTRDHDLHHKLFNVNFSFPFPFMDMLHGTYLREVLGMAPKLPMQQEQVTPSIKSSPKCSIT